MNYTGQISGYITLINQLVGSKVAPDSVDPTDVVTIGKALADLLLPILNGINNFAITGGTLPPSNANGNDLDLYIQGGTSLTFWRKRNGIWSQEAVIPLGIQIIDGNITLQASVNEQVVTVSAGSWGINNIVYSKAVQTQLNLTAADLNFNRIDTIAANNAGDILLINGVANANPDPAALPPNTIVVAYVYIPSSSSGDLPYISDSNSSPATIIDDLVVSLVKTWSSAKLNRMPQPWSIAPTPVHGVRWRSIGGVNYTFCSLVDENITEPSLSQGVVGIQPWRPEGGPVLNWDNATPFALGQLVLNPYFSSTWMYRSKVAGNAGHDPQDDYDHLYWERVGNYVGAAWAKDYYSVDETVISSNGIAYTSMIYNNNYALDAVAPPWRKSSQVVGTIPNYGYNTPYSKDNYVKQQVNIGGTLFTIVYQSKQDNNIQQFPDGGQYDLFWRTVGTFLGEYVEGQVYNQFSVVISTQAGVTNIYLSNKADNTDLVTAVVEPKKWEVLGPAIKDDETSDSSIWSSEKTAASISAAAPTALTFSNTDLDWIFDGNYSLSFNLPSGKSIVSIERLQGRVISRAVAVSQAITTPANNPNTIIEGFDNNGAQTITIKIQ